MSDTPYLGELRLMSFNFAPKGWATCDGQLLPINQNQPMFSLLGTMYGGDGRVTFALPDLRGRVPLHMGNGFVVGQPDGEESHLVTVGELPTHSHTLQASPLTADQATPSILAANGNAYGAPTGSLTTLHPASLASVGGGQPHENRPPSLVLTWCIALQGVFPTQD
ncbi:MAG TPA: tail fiber protein [Conexibacter sp.]|jgi:microcystin-dependent protein